MRLGPISFLRPQAAGPNRDELVLHQGLNTGYGQLPYGTSLTDVSTDNGMEFTFDVGVKNLLGPDILIIENGNGDDLRIRGIDAAGTVTLSVLKNSGHWGVDSNAHETFHPSWGFPACMSTLKTGSVEIPGSAWTISDRGGTLIDLSDLGYASDAVATGIFIQCQSDGTRLDPMIVAGLNEVPEPSTLVLLLTFVFGASTLVLCRRRKRS